MYVDCRLLLQAGPRNLVPLSIQLDIPVPRVAHNDEAPGFEGESEPPLLPAPPLKIGPRPAADWLPPTQQGLVLKPANITGDIARFILLFQVDEGYRRPNGQKA